MGLGWLELLALQERVKQADFDWWVLVDLLFVAGPALAGSRGWQLRLSRTVEPGFAMLRSQLGNPADAAAVTPAKIAMNHPSSSAGLQHEYPRQISTENTMLPAGGVVNPGITEAHILQQLENAPAGNLI